MSAAGKFGKERTGWRDSDAMARVHRSLPVALAFLVVLGLMIPIFGGWISRVAAPEGEALVRVVATQDGTAWSGSLAFRLNGAEQWNGSMAPYELIVHPGVYTITVAGGGPRNARLKDVTPSGSQLGRAGGTVTFTIEFTGGERPKS